MSAGTLHTGGDRAAANARELLRSVRHQLGLARVALASAPLRISAVYDRLESAVVGFRSCQPLLRSCAPPSRTALRAEVEILQGEIAAIRAQLACTASFYRGWTNVLGGMQHGYTFCGIAAQPMAAQRVSVEG